MLFTHMIMKLNVVKIFLKTTFTNECFCLFFCYTSFFDETFFFYAFLFNFSF